MPASSVTKDCIELLAAKYGFSPQEALRLCAEHVEDFPKNLRPPVVKAAGPVGIKWASKAAEAEAVALGVKVPRGFESESKSGKVTLEDVRTLAREQGLLAKKPHATPGAIAYAEEHDLDWAEVQDAVEPGGSDDKYIITDLKKFQKLHGKAKPKPKAKGKAAASSSTQPLELPSAFGFINSSPMEQDSESEDEDLEEVDE
jgi:pyruvate/2-oxoglutarate dehydrogenase complex dihydrolipoamide acyltransferase (E2) component